MSRFTQCAAPGWNSGSRSGGDLPVGAAKLSVFRVVRTGSREVFARGDHDGRVFPSCEAASAFALERGYSVLYRRADVGTFKRVHRAALRRIMCRARVSLDLAVAPAEVVGIADRVKAEVRALGCDVLMPLAWSNGVYTMARRLRPGLLPR